ncbi:MAG: trp operon repressor [Treponema sp.]|jgi:TrpR family trp operon transcriptional repressor|nr:trp operon repressor [Treponema sp.]
MKINDPAINENLSEISFALAKTEDAQFVKDFLLELLTPAETADIADRWALVKALDRKVPQRIIAKNLGLSLCKITRGSREIKKPNSAFRRMLRQAQVSQNENIQQ